MEKCILIVDDSKTIRVSVEYTLKKSGYTVRQAADGDEAIQLLQTLQPQNVGMIITDVNMPKMDGITFVKEVRKMGGFRFTPILVLTTESVESKKMEGKAAGASGWLVKPFTPDQLVGVVKKFVHV